MSEEQYAESKYAKWHRYASLGMVVGGAVVFGSRFGVGGTLRSFANFALPLALIWFADRLGEWAIEASGGWLNASNADTAVRIAGWSILLIMLVPRVAMALSTA